MKKWLGLAALGAAIAALFSRNKRKKGDEDTSTVES